MLNWRREICDEQIACSFSSPSKKKKKEKIVAMIITVILQKELLNDAKFLPLELEALDGLRL